VMAAGIKKIGGVHLEPWYEDEVAKAERGNREHIAKYDRSFNGIMAKADTDGDEKDNKMTDITKAHKHRGPHELAASLVQHLHDRLDRHRERHGYTKAAKETSPMTALEDIAKSYGVPGVVEIAKNIVDAEKSYRITEEEFVKLIDTAARVAHPELGARAFEKVYERNPLLARAIAVIKAGLAEQLLSGGMPVQVGGDGSQHTKADRGTAYGDLMEKAEEYRNAHPELSIAQCFEKVFTAPANRELAKRERIESAPG
jgi:hypothetical protein